MDTQVSKLKKVGLAILVAGVVCATASANDRDKAKRIHDRIAGVPPSAAVLDQMEQLVHNGDAMGAAHIATQNASFYNVTLKNMAVPWTNRDQTVFAPLNDYVATFIGMVRDNVPFNTALSADLAYTVNGVTPAASPSNNDHYANAETNAVNLMTALQATTQSSILGIPADATAGFITSRASSEAFFVDGTNRAMFRFTLMNHLCRDLEQVHDISLPPDMIRQDVSRSPGGDSRIFLNNCIGCHSGMDPMARAFAYYDFDNGTVDAPGTMRLVYTPGTVQPKYFNNDTNFAPGFRTPDDHWVNRWRQGQNSRLGWDSGLTGQGVGAKSLGQELGNSDAFAQCQVEKVFKTVCFRAPGNQADRQVVTNVTAAFKANYSLKEVFERVATSDVCLGQ
ncbi:MAG TPA: hypothetical protein VJP84_14775 [Steroidobacteraceae bacterium]|jgi:hypothetical protein|nr:hypothetical protein [Steroidobacteraceae bacterium]